MSSRIVAVDRQPWRSKAFHGAAIRFGSDSKRRVGGAFSSSRIARVTSARSSPVLAKLLRKTPVE